MREIVATRHKHRLFFHPFLFLLASIVLSACQFPSAPDKDNNFHLEENDHILDCDPLGDSSGALACQLAYYTNRERRANPEESDLAQPLDWDEDLAEVAKKYCERMCDEGFFDHNDPRGHAMESRLQDAGIFFVKAGENLARGTDLFPSGAFALFMGEPPCELNHRGNVLDNDFTQTGAGTSFCGSKTIYTQLFATFDQEDLRDDSNEFCSNHSFTD